MSDAPDPAELAHGGVRLYNAGRFWEAHEAWEAVWRAAPDPERRTWQGLIQAAAAMLHRERGNAHGLAALGEAAVSKLMAPAPPGFPIETARFAAALARCVRENGAVPRVELATPFERSERSGGRVEP